MPTALEIAKAIEIAENKDQELQENAFLLLVLKKMAAELNKHSKSLIRSGQSGSKAYDVRIFANVTGLSEEKIGNICGRVSDQLVEDLLCESIRNETGFEEKKAKIIADYTQCLTAAGMTYTDIQEVPNEYCRQHCCLIVPWAVYQTLNGPVKIGWRKHVLNISWTADIFGGFPRANELFPNEDVTKGEYSIHAWGYSKATEYLKALSDWAKSKNVANPYLGQGLE